MMSAISVITVIASRYSATCCLNLLGRYHKRDKIKSNWS